MCFNYHSRVEYLIKAMNIYSSLVLFAGVGAFDFFSTISPIASKKRSVKSCPLMLSGDWPRQFESQQSLPGQQCPRPLMRHSSVAEVHPLYVKHSVVAVGFETVGVAAEQPFTRLCCTKSW